MAFNVWTTMALSRKSSIARPRTDAFKVNLPISRFSPSFLFTNGSFFSCEIRALFINPCPDSPSDQALAHGW